MQLFKKCLQNRQKPHPVIRDTIRAGSIIYLSFFIHLHTYFFSERSQKQTGRGRDFGATFPRIILLVFRKTETFLSWEIVFIINKHLVCN